HRLRQFLNDHAIQGEAISDIENKSKNGEFIKTEIICMFISYFVWTIIMLISFDSWFPFSSSLGGLALFFIIVQAGGMFLARLISSIKDTKYLYEKFKRKEQIESKDIKQFLIRVGSMIGFGVLYFTTIYFVM
uniref:hypothetical protein n=1 Tax=Longirhabdus pacifica TaxID=2305227 RepID=UPI0013E8E861